MKMSILALDSSTEACSVALLTGQEVVEKFEVIGRGHAEQLLPMINALLEENDASLDDIDLFAYGSGPGSFTGLRIGAAMMQGLALARERKLIAVSSLAALASRQQGIVLSVIDARMDQVYHGLYRIQKDAPPELTGEISVSFPDEINLPDRGNIILTGTGLDRYKDKFMLMNTADRGITGINDEYPHAADIARLALYESVQGRETDPADALPHYVRDKVAKTVAER
ncbi:MAG: tRNA (adenosine(37)-N6)-threonylcarbamoyltransferase complex dimerization subunit type 1 TsaB [Gammaproteobacteria bacterium]|nr:MAG: tRNA (adenosine(37)-N6)-threonylcarbamoyltransferase complex dimerization subunit type 1 TsaB [Gammaproteobacteria bacterium]